MGRLRLADALVCIKFEGFLPVLLVVLAQVLFDSCVRISVGIGVRREILSKSARGTKVDIHGGWGAVLFIAFGRF